MIFVVTCEHGGNFIPAEFSYLFKNAENELNSHRGIDFGALDLFRELQPYADFSQFQEVSRLLVEMNRSQENPDLFSEFTDILSSSEKEEILRKYYFPYRNQVEKYIFQKIEEGQEVFHLSVHSFTPEFNGEIRNTDLGFLFDPEREREEEICEFWKKKIHVQNPKVITKYNYPYLGTADGFTTFLRKRFPKNYSGIELEVNQKFVSGNKMEPNLKYEIRNSLLEVLLTLKRNK